MPEPVALRPHPCVSICIPVLNEEKNIEALLRRVGAVLASLPDEPQAQRHELLVVDDGSSDRSRDLLRAASPASNRYRIRVVSLSRNFGHQMALSAALDHSRGDVCFLIDGDLQDRPEELPRFIEEYRRGADVVFARRTKRKEPLWLRVSYWVFYRIARGLSELPLPLDAGDFSLISRRVVEVIKRTPERNRYLRGLRSWAGFRQVEIAVERAPRTAGESKYGLFKLLKLACDGLFSFSVVPLRLAALVGAITLAGSMAFAAYAAYAKFFLDSSPQGFTALTFIMVTASGIQLLFMGVIGEYVGRIYQESKQRPHYVVDEVFESP